MQLWRYRCQQRYRCTRSGRATTCRAASTATRPQQDLGRRSAQLKDLVQDIASTAAQSGPRGLFRGLQVADAVSRITRCSCGSVREPDAVRGQAGLKRPSHATAGSTCVAWSQAVLRLHPLCSGSSLSALGPLTSRQAVIHADLLLQAKHRSSQVCFLDVAARPVYSILTNSFPQGVCHRVSEMSRPDRRVCSQYCRLCTAPSLLLESPHLPGSVLQIPFLGQPSRKQFRRSWGSHWRTSFCGWTRHRSHALLWLRHVCCT